MTQNKNNNLQEVEDPNAKYYEPKPEGEKQFWKRHIIQKHKDRNGNGDDVFGASNVKKDDSVLPQHKDKLGAPKGNLPADQLKGEKGIKEEKMTSGEKSKREEIVKAMKKKTAGFKERYGDRWKDVMYATATKQAMGEEVEDLDEVFDGSTLTIHKPGHSLHGKKAHIFHRFDDGRINAQVRGGHGVHFKRGDVQNFTLKPGEYKLNEDSQAATSDNPGGSQPSMGNVDNNNSHLNNNPTGDPKSKGDVKDTLEKIAMQAAELHDNLEDGQEIDSQAQEALGEAKDALEKAYEMLTQDSSPKNESVEDVEEAARYGSGYRMGGRSSLSSLPSGKRFSAYSKLKLHYDPTAPDPYSPEEREAARKKLAAGKINNEEFENIDDYEEIFEDVESLEEASVKNEKGEVIGTHKPEEGFKPNALGKRLGHKPHPTDAPKGTTIAKRGRPSGAKSFGASKRKDQTSDEAGAHSEKPSFTDQLLKATNSHEGAHVTFDNGKTHHVPRVHARNALYHLGKPEKPADKEKVRKHIGASKENFDSFRKSGGQLPKEAPKYSPDAKIRARTSQIISGKKSPTKTAQHKAMAQKILAMRKDK